MNREKPHNIGVETVVDGIHFYVEKDDEWFFNNHDLYVSIDSKTDELIYDYKK